MLLSQEQKLFLAPMAEITTPVFRQAVRSFSDEVVLYTEMLSARYIVANSLNYDTRSSVSPGEGTVIAQILGNDPESMSLASEVLSGSGFAGIDINMGCSAPEILHKGWGAALLKDRTLTKTIIQSCRAKTSGYLSIKMRSGFKEHEVDMLLDLCRMFANEGVDWITLHGRPAKIGFSRMSDWNIIKELADISKIPVVGNGDINDPVSAVKRLSESGCKGIMIGRAAVQQPWIFKLISDLKTGKNSNLTIDIENVFINILSHIKENLPLSLHKSRAHRFALYFCKNVKFSHCLFREIRRLNAIDEMCDIIHAYFDRNPEERYNSYN